MIWRCSTSLRGNVASAEVNRAEGRRGVDRLHCQVVLGAMVRVIWGSMLFMQAASQQTILALEERKRIHISGDFGLSEVDALQIGSERHV